MSGTRAVLIVLVALSVFNFTRTFGQTGNARAQDKPGSITAIPDLYRTGRTIGVHKDRTASISVGDVDGDGDADLVIANGRHWPGQNRIFLNNGKGGLTVEKNLTDERSTTYAIPLADFDGDGDLDAVVGNDRAPSFVLINDGKGNFRKSQQIGGIVNTRSISLADIDNQHGLDILVTNRGESNEIFFNDGRGHFGRSKRFGTRNDSTIDVATGDFDQDGSVDLAVANRDRQPNRVYFGDGKGNFPRSIEYGTGKDETRGVAVIDFDQDGHLDILNANIGQPNAIYFGDGKGGFARSQSFGGNANSFDLKCVGLNRNQKQLAIIVANVGSENAVYLPSKDGKLSQTHFGIKNGTTYGVAVADINGDGIAEIATANSDQQNGLYTQKRNRGRRK